MSPPRRKPDPVPVILSMLSSTARQLGAGMVVAGVFALAIGRMYQDLERKNEMLISLVREQTDAAREVSAALRELLDKLSRP